MIVVDGLRKLGFNGAADGDRQRGAGVRPLACRRPSRFNGAADGDRQRGDRGHDRTLLELSRFNGAADGDRQSGTCQRV